MIISTSRSLTFEQFNGFLLCACDVLLLPWWWASRTLMFHKEMWALNNLCWPVIHVWFLPLAFLGEGVEVVFATCRENQNKIPEVCQEKALCFVCVRRMEGYDSRPLGMELWRVMIITSKICIHTFSVNPLLATGYVILALRCKSEDILFGSLSLSRHHLALIFI